MYPPLLKLASTLVAWDEREDLVQDALVQVLRRYPDFAGVQHPLGYARTVVIRTATGRGRAQAVRDRTSLAMDRIHPDALDDSVVGRAAFEDVLTRLGPRQRACLYLRFAADFTDEQISDVLGCRSSTVRSQISRALQSLADPTPTQGDRYV